MMYPPLNMHFIVEFDDKDLNPDRNFQSVQGLSARVVDAADKNKKSVQFQNIILRRAYQPESKLVKWCMNAINNQTNTPVNFTVKLLNAQHEMLSGWKIENAIPVAWGVEELHSQDTKILIEVIELEYLRFHVLNSKGENVVSRVIKPLKRKILKGT